MQPYLKRFSENLQGKDYVVGDIHGCFSKLEDALNRIGFDRSVDRLFSVGDLVDRGPECQNVLKWLDYPWFYAVRGNHDDFVLRYKTVDQDNWIVNGGLWFMSLLDHEKQELADAMSVLPLVIEVETPNGLVGIVHADPIIHDWSCMEEFLNENRRNRNGVMWSRRRVESLDDSPVQNVHKVIVGHTPNPRPYVLGNVHHIDTYGWKPEGAFTFMDITTGTLRTVVDIPSKL